MHSPNCRPRADSQMSPSPNSLPFPNPIQITAPNKTALYVVPRCPGFFFGGGEGGSVRWHARRACKEDLGLGGELCCFSKIETTAVYTANEKNSNGKCPIHLLTRKKENKPQVFFAKIPCYTVLSLLNHKTHQYTNTPRFFSGEAHTACFFPNRDSIFRHQKNTLNRSVLCSIIGRAALLLLLLLLLFRIGKLPIDRGNGNGIGGKRRKKKKWLRIAARRNRSQFPILLFLDCCFILYGTVYDVYLFIQQQEREGAKKGTEFITF